MSVWGGEWTCGIGVAVSDKPEGPFLDKGKLFQSKDIDVQNSIDQFYIEDKGKKYLFWGSFRGIYAIELGKDGLSLKPDAAKKRIAGTAFEGTYIYKKRKYYYMFASIGSCCEGIKSTYQLVVGRSIDFERKAMEKTALLPLVDGSAMSPSFGHIFSGGYAAGYYGYKWAEVLDADAFALFKETGIFNKETAESFRKNILERGNTEEPMSLYVKFRGQEPSVDALLIRNGVKK